MFTTELNAISTLLDEGRPVNIQAPSFFRWFGKKSFNVNVRTPFAGTSMKILEIRLKINLTDAQLFDEELTVEHVFALQVAHGKDVAQIVALGILRKKSLLRPIYYRILANYLLGVKEFRELLELMEEITLGCGGEAFINTIRLTKVLRLTKPNLSQPTTQKS